MTKTIGGMFPLERPGKGDNYREEGIIYAMSGRCAIYTCLKDIDAPEGSIAYVPAYTCETVLSCYVKAGYRLRFYDVDPDGMVPLFREEDLEGVTVINVCGWFGFLTYDHSFMEKCREHGVKILFDTTHSPLYYDELSDYAAGSLRKWMGIACGGVARKLCGSFNVRMLPAEEEHLRGRYASMALREEAIEEGSDEKNAQASEVFWNTELRLRQIFDAYSSDERSIEIAKHFDFESMREKRCRHFEIISSTVKPNSGWRPVFTKLGKDDIPSHYTIYCSDREDMKRYLDEMHVKYTAFWPQPPMVDDISRYPGAGYINTHVLSVQLDQRWSDEDMLRLSEILNGYSAK